MTDKQRQTIGEWYNHYSRMDSDDYALGALDAIDFMMRQLNYKYDEKSRGFYKYRNTPDESEAHE